ncbi:MAG: hypothetical protein Kow00117_23620 [Phototrophicales bacterium]|nr:MAG: hypothetical protein CUN56_07545 [Phototrophicales bacterium]
MRYIHPVGGHEKFVASGIYHHQYDGVDTGTTESWSIHELPDGAWMIRVDEDYRAQDGSSVLIEGWRSPLTEGGQLLRVDIHAFSGKHDDIKQVRATYTVDEDVLQIGREINNGEREWYTLQLPAGYILSPECLIFAGFEVDELATRQDKRASVIGYFPTFISDYAFKPVVYQPVARFIGDEQLTLGNKTYQARHFEQTESLHLWVDQHTILLKYEAGDASHGAVLHQYAHR